MLTMAQINCIREMYFEKGMNYASIARVSVKFCSQNPSALHKWIMPPVIDLP